MKKSFRIGLLAVSTVLTVGLGACASTTAPTANAGLLNAKCPMMPNCAKPLGVTTQYNAGLIGFCCGGCKAEWSQLDDETKAARFAAVKK